MLEQQRSIPYHHKFWKFCLLYKRRCAPSLKPGGFSLSAAVFWGNLHSKFAEVVGLSRTNRYANSILIKFVEKSTKHIRVGPPGGTRGSCTAILPLLGITEFSTKLAEKLPCLNLGHVGVTSARMKRQKSLKNWPQLEEEFPEVCLIVKRLFS